MEKITKLYDFRSQKILGKSGEEILDSWLGSFYKILDVSEVKKYQETGIDRVLMRPDGTTISVEYKFDLASSRTGNLFFETVSVDNKNIPGWGWCSQADYWIFLLPSMEVLIIEPSKFRNLVWQYRLDFKDKSVQNSGYKTLGVPVPLRLVKNIAYRVIKLSQ